MSQAVFPTLPGLTWNVTRAPMWNTKVQRSPSGQELRASYATRPRYRYVLDFELLRTAAAFAELQTLVSFFNARQGSFDSWLFSDPADSSVSLMGFGRGDGATTAFQIQRGRGGQVQDRLGTWARPTVPAFNYLSYSDDVSNAAWIKGTGVTAVANAAVAPDGTVTASRVTYDGSGSAGGWRFYQNAAGLTFPRGLLFTHSAWLRADAPLSLRMGTNNGENVTWNITTAWQRFVYPGTHPGDGYGALSFQLVDLGANTMFTLYLWGATVENGTAASPRIATTSAPASLSPVFWPAGGDGYEPIADFAAPPTLYRDGDWQGRVPLSSGPRTNNFGYSTALENWILQNGATAVASGLGSLDGLGVAPRYLKNATGTAFSAAYTVLVTVPGKAYTVSGWLLGDGTNVQCDIGALVSGTFLAVVDARILQGPTIYAPVGIANAGLGGLQRVSALNGNAWTRFSLTFIATSTSADVYVYGNGYNATAVTGTYVWGLMCEEGLVAGDYIPTAGGIASRTDYTLDPVTGVVTLAVAPPLYSWLLWSGSYFWRCRFEQDQTEFRNFLQNLWEARAVSFLTTF